MTTLVMVSQIPHSKTQHYRLLSSQLVSMYCGFVTMAYPFVTW